MSHLIRVILSWISAELCQCSMEQWEDWQSRFHVAYHLAYVNCSTLFVPLASQHGFDSTEIPFLRTAQLYVQLWQHILLDTSCFFPLRKMNWQIRSTQMPQLLSCNHKQKNLNKEGMIRVFPSKCQLLTHFATVHRHRPHCW